MMSKQPKTKYEVILHAKDLRRAVFRAGGPGGQHQNKTESAVRYTHIPTGIAAESRSDKSQHRNDEIALESLKEKIIRLWLFQKGKDMNAAYTRKPDVAFGSQMRSYVLHGHRRCTDHSTEWSGDPVKVLNGEIDGLLKARLVHAMNQEWQTTEPIE